MKRRLRAKIDKYAIYQLGESTLSVTNLSSDGTKMKKGSRKKCPKVPIGKGLCGAKKEDGAKTETIEVQNGNEVLSVTFICQNEDDVPAVSKLLFETLKFDFIDKYKGTYKVFTQNAKITNSDSNARETVFNCTFIVQGIVVTPTEDPEIPLQDLANGRDGFALKSIADISKIISDGVRKGTDVVDSVTDYIGGGIMDLMVLGATINNVAVSIEDRLVTLERLGYAMKRVTTMPQELLDTFLSIGDSFAKNDRYVPIEPTKTYNSRDPLNDLFITDLYSNQIGVSLEEEEALKTTDLYGNQISIPYEDWEYRYKDTLSSEASDEAEIIEKLNNATNTIKFLASLKLFMSGNITTYSDFKKLYEQTLELLNAIDEESIENKPEVEKKIIDFFGNNKPANPRKIDVPKDLSLWELVFENARTKEEAEAIYNGILEINKPFLSNFNLFKPFAFIDYYGPKELILLPEVS